MLEQSIDFMKKASPEAIAAAEDMALAKIATDLVQDLIPLDRAFQIAEEHRTAVTEEWKREVHSALVALAVLKEQGHVVSVN